MFVKSLPLLIIDLLIWAFLLPLVLPLLVIFSLYKSFVCLLILLFRSDLTPISTYDIAVARATLDKKPIVDIGFILKVKGNVDLTKLREKFKEHFVQNEIPSSSDPFYSLHCTFESYWGYLCKKRADLDLSEQIREDPVKISDPQSYFSTWLHSRYRNDKAPRWEMVLVKSAKVKEESYVALRMHHGLIDGFGMLLIVDKLCGQKSPYMVQEEPPLTLKEKLSMLLEVPRELGTYWFKASRSSWPLSDIKDVDKIDKMLVSWGTLDIASLKEVRRKLDVPFSTILYVLQTGALRRHLLETGRGQEITDTLPVFHTIAKPNHPKYTFTNHWTFVKLHTPFANPDPVSRIHKTERLYKEFIDTRLHISGPMFIGGFANLIPTKYCFLNKQIAISLYKVSLSSMVRASEQYKLFGMDVTNIYHTFCTKDLCPQTVLYTTTASHNQQIDITLAAAPDLVGDQKGMNRLAEKHFKDELDDLISRCKI